MSNRALIIVDVQRDFCEGGSLAVAGGAAVAKAINEVSSSGDYAHVVATKDHHIDPGEHFVEWPAHCVAGSDGWEFHPNLDASAIEAVFQKGEYEAAYSGFEGAADGATLADWLRDRGVTEVDVCGIATDYCVRATALDAANAGFRTRVLLDLTAGISEETCARAIEEMTEAGCLTAGQPLIG